MILRSHIANKRSPNYDLGAGPFFQPKLSINTPGDRYEQEADAVAENIMRMSSSHTPVKPVTGLIGNSVQRKCAACEEEEKKIMRKTEGSGYCMQASPSLVSSINASKGGGSRLPRGMQNFMENAFSTDFSRVRVHTDSGASEMSKGINAKAFTTGSDIYFKSGEYRPDTSNGKQLLAHELTHVVQQNTGEVNRSIQRQFDQACAELMDLPSVSGLLTGIQVHAKIQEFFLETTPGATKIGIPGGSAAPLRTAGLCGGDTTSIASQIIGGMAGMGFPDLAALNNGELEVAEIKPASIGCLVDGESQLAGYVDQGNALDTKQVAWRAEKGIGVVVPMSPFTFHPVPIQVGSLIILVSWCMPGVIGYSVMDTSSKRKKNSVKVPVRVPGTQPARVPKPLPATTPISQSVPTGVEIPDVAKDVTQVLKGLRLVENSMAAEEGGLGLFEIWSLLESW